MNYDRFYPCDFVNDKLSLIFEENNDLLLSYVDLITKNYNNPKIKGKTEAHHVLPKSIFPEYKTDKWNIVNLSYYDHALAHYYLAKTSNSKMCYAFHRMINSNTDRFNTNELDEILKLYSSEKELFHRSMSKLSKNIWKDDDFRKRHRELTKLAMQKPEVRNKTLLNLSNAMKTDEVRNKISRLTKLAMQKPEVKEKHRNSLRLAYANPEVMKRKHQRLREKYTLNLFGAYKDGVLLKTFNYIPDAAKYFNISSKGNILKCLNGERKSVEGYNWKYINEL
ncbi:putative homing endonuclease [Escherichia phage KK4]|nr:putative homing endonuclease [Escherichia phage GADU22]WMM91778.1 putative homing endonuclease [Escherichia phage KK4]